MVDFPRFFTLFFTLLLSLSPTFAYVPAYPTNDTEAAKASGLNFTDESRLELYWPGGVLEVSVSHRLAGKNNGAGRLKGAFVHLSEPLVSGETTTPWVAHIPCDANATDSSLEVDIFTLAQNKGAVAVLLYSLYSTTCIIDPAYISRGSTIDVFVSTSKQMSNLVNLQFSNANSVDFDAKKLNDSASYVNDTLIDVSPSTRGYLISWLVFYELGFSSSRAWETPFSTLPTNSNSQKQTQTTVTPTGTGTTGTQNNDASQTLGMSSVFAILLSMAQLMIMRSLF